MSNNKEFNENLKLLLSLALVPIAIFICVFLYGEGHFDSSTLAEKDVAEEEPDLQSINISENNNAFAANINRKMQLPAPKTVEKSQTTKGDKRLLGPNGGMQTVELKAGQTLESLAQQKFGNKAFWVYFYDVNRDKLNNPDDAKAGMKLYIPNPEFFGFSASDNGSVQYAQRRAEEIRKGK